MMTAVLFTGCPPELWSIFGAAREVRADRFLCTIGAIPSRAETAGFLRHNELLLGPGGRRIRSPREKLPLNTALLGGKPASDLAKAFHVALYKPVGAVCEHAGPHSSPSRTTVYDLLPKWPSCSDKLQLNSVGRLDADSSGLLLLSQSGALIHRLAAPKRHARKTYLVDVRPADLNTPPMDDQTVLRVLASGDLHLKGEKKPCLPVNAEWVPETQRQYGDTRRIRLTLTQGLYHQIKRMMPRFGWQVSAIHRENFSFLSLKDSSLSLHKPGDWAILSDSIVERLWHGN